MDLLLLTARGVFVVDKCVLRLTSCSMTCNQYFGPIVKMTEGGVYPGAGAACPVEEKAPSDIHYRCPFFKNLENLIAARERDVRETILEEYRT